MKKETEYLKKLRDPRWQKKRLKIFERDEFTCDCCESKDNPLCVHHLSYNGEPWETDDDRLITLCESCHENVERMIRRVRSIHPISWIAFDLLCDLLERPGSECVIFMLMQYKSSEKYSKLIDSIAELCFEKRMEGYDRGLEMASKHH
jgi:hypothetical protein